MTHRRWKFRSLQPAIEIDAGRSERKLVLLSFPSLHLTLPIQNWFHINEQVNYHHQEWAREDTTYHESKWEEKNKSIYKRRAWSIEKTKKNENFNSKIINWTLRRELWPKCETRVSKCTKLSWLYQQKVSRVEPNNGIEVWKKNIY